MLNRCYGNFVARLIAIICEIMTRYFFDNGEIDKLVKQIKSIYGGIYSLNEHCWQQLKATSIKKSSK